MHSAKRVLFTSHTANFSKFNRPFMRWFKQQGYEVHYASAGEEEVLDCDMHYAVCFDRTPWSFRNVTAYRQLKKNIDQENYEIIHTHTPMGSVVTRLAARAARKRGTKVIYTAHGFHFFSGAPLVNWLIYYPIEKILMKHADRLVTINSEDYVRATTNFKGLAVEKIDGVGVDLSRFKPVDDLTKNALRKKYGFNKEDFIITVVAEFTTNKGHEFIVNAIKPLVKTIPNLKLVFAGTGYRFEATKALVKKLNLANTVQFVGYRNDVEKFYQLSDLTLSASRREGLPLNLVEAMATGLPVICTKTRGHVDIVTNRRNGLLFSVNDADELRQSLVEIYENSGLRRNMTESNSEDVSRYSVEQAVENMKNIYEKLL